MTGQDVLIGFVVVVFVATVVVGGFTIAGIIRDLLMERRVREPRAPRRLSRMTAARVQYGVLFTTVWAFILNLAFIPRGIAYIAVAASTLVLALSVSITASYLSRGEPAKPAARAKSNPEPRPRRRLTQRAADRIMLGTVMAGMFAMFPGSIPFIGHDEALQAWLAGIVILMGAVLATTFYFAREYAPAKPKPAPKPRRRLTAKTVENVRNVVYWVVAAAAALQAPGHPTLLILSFAAASLPFMLPAVSDHPKADTPALKSTPEPEPLPADALTGDDRAWFDLWGTNAGIPPELPAEPAPAPQAQPQEDYAAEVKRGLRGIRQANLAQIRLRRPGDPR